MSEGQNLCMADLCLQDRQVWPERLWYHPGTMQLQVQLHSPWNETYTIQQQAYVKHTKHYTLWAEHWQELASRMTHSDD